MARIENNHICMVLGYIALFDSDAMWLRLLLPAWLPKMQVKRQKSFFAGPGTWCKQVI